MTDSFMTEKGMVANSVEIFVGKETPSVVGVEVLNETTVLEIPVQAVFDLMQQYPRMAKLYVRCLHQALEFQNEINIKRLAGRAISATGNGSAKSGRKSIRSQVISRLLLFGHSPESLSRLRHQKRKHQ